MQLPPLHTGVVPPQTFVHEPQFVLSVRVSTQTPLQAVSPGPQQIPLVQVSPTAQATPPAVPAQPPQFASSVSGSEHEPPQLF